jgi:CBS-domain-containing membrane protein
VRPVNATSKPSYYKYKEIRMKYFSKMKGTTKSPPAVSLSEIIWSWIGSFAGIAAVAVVNFAIVDKTDLVMIIGSFGASAVLIYGAIRSPLAQPRNLIGGHMISAAIGVTTYKLLPAPLWLTSAIAVATSIAVMHATCYWQSKNSQSWISICSNSRGGWSLYHAYGSPVSE